MRLLHIIPSMDPIEGGTCQCVRNLNDPLIKMNIHCEVVSLDDPNAYFLGSDSFVIHALGPRKTPWQYSSKLLPWLLENLNRFDIVVVNGLWLYHIYAAMKALKILKKRNLTSINDSSKIPKFFVMPHGMLDPYFQRASSRKLKAIRNWVYWKLIEGEIINNADAIIFTCEAERLLAHEPFRPYHPKKDVVMGPGVESPPLYQEHMMQAFLEKCPNVVNSRYLLFLSRIHEKKGVDLLINAYAKLLDQSDRYKDLKLVIAGPGLESDYGIMLRKQVQSNELLINQVSFTGMLAGDAKWGAFYGSEAFILPSHQENFGIAVVEALACGKPVLISNQINIWREIEASGAGKIANDTLEGTEENLKYWYKLNDEEKADLGRKAYLCFGKNFTKDLAAQKFFSIIKDMDLQLLDEQERIGNSKK